MNDELGIKNDGKISTSFGHKSILISIIVFIFSISASAQNDVQFTQFFFNKMYYNPAYAGSKEALTLSAIYRHQWESIVGAPKTFNFNVHAPFFNNRAGGGLAVTSDKIGITNSIFVDASYAYIISLENNNRLSFGLRYRFEHSDINWTQIDAIDMDDDLVPEADTRNSGSNFGFGMYLNHPNYYIGLSVPSILETTTYEVASSGDIKDDTRTLYLMAGLIAPINKSIKIKPALLVSYNNNAPVGIDGNLSLLFLEQFLLGITYRLEDSVDGVIQYQVSKQLKLGFAFDYTMSELDNYTTGSFELMMEYVFLFKNDKVYNIRFF